MSQHRETIMRQGSTAMGVVTFLGAVLCMAVTQAKDFPFDYTYCHSGSTIVVSASKDLTVSSSESRGIIRSNIADKTLENHTFHCVGVGRSGEQSANHGYCKVMSPDGDFWVAEYAREDTEDFTWKALQGTGRWQGITGGGTFRTITQGKPITPGTFQNCGRATGKFTLPD